MFQSIDANSTELAEDTPDPVVIYMPEVSRTHLGGTMRLGLRPTVFEPDTGSWSQLRKLYAGHDTIWERHRHRYEVNPEYVQRLEESGLRFVGKDEQNMRMQAIELNGVDQIPLSNHALITQSTSSCFRRSSVLCGFTGPSRVLHPAPQPIAALPRPRCRGVRFFCSL